MRLSLAALATSLTLLCACAGKVEATIPTAMHPASSSSDGPDSAATKQPAPVLLVMLPGAGDRVGTYDEHGIVEATRAAGLDVDLLEVDAHPGYYFGDRTLLERMDTDVLGPNRGRYEEIWIVGISMGGIGALLTAWTYPEDIDGLILMSPYLGKRKTLSEIDKAGGLRVWEPPAEIDERDWQDGVWTMLKQATSGERDLEIYLGYGESDLGVRAHDLLAAALPEGHVDKIPGGHSWKTWTTLWDRIAAKAPLPRAD